eukprot:Rmarinus@m.687
MPQSPKIRPVEHPKARAHGSILAGNRRVSHVFGHPQSAGLHDLPPSRIVHLSNLQIDAEPSHVRKTSIICTIGPNTNSVPQLKKLIESGMDIVRMNFSHGSHEYHKSVIVNARAAVKESQGSVIAIALDTKGPEIRTGLLAGDSDVLLKEGSTIVITTDDAHKENCSESLVYVDYKNLPKVMEVDGLIYIDDGLISLKVLSMDETSCTCEVLNSGLLGSRKGVNLPDVAVDLPALSEKDKADLKFGVANGIDMVFASFIRKREDVLAVREALGEEGEDVMIISKIENHEGIRNFDEILSVTDGVMVARGDLGIEIPVQKVWKAQKMMISKCMIAGKPVICATQMLESMVNNPRPTRAEVSDVANAVIDGADCVMLSGETAKGKYPMEAVRMMASVCLEAESALPYVPINRTITDATPKPLSVSESVAAAAVRASFEQGAGCIIVLSLRGASARKIAKYRPHCPIIAVTRNTGTGRHLLLSRGVLPLIYEPQSPAPISEDEYIFSQANIQDRLTLAEEFVLRHGVCKAGDFAVLVHGIGKEGGEGRTSIMRVIRLGKQ